MDAEELERLEKRVRDLERELETVKDVLRRGLLQVVRGVERLELESPRRSVRE